MKDKIILQQKIIEENSVDVISSAELRERLEFSQKNHAPLKLKIGFDPTSSDVHLGHTVILRKLRKLQDFGHIVYFIIGDFTARIGDPSGRLISRPVLSEKEIKKNASTYAEQAFKILKKDKTKIIYNSCWYKNMLIEDFFSLLSLCTVARILERDDFSRRLKENKPLSLLEIIYPLIQGYDSVKIKADIEFGGTDQKFNLILARHLQESFGQRPQIAITLPLLVGLDGKEKMSKSLGNYIGVTEPPGEMFGKIMSISDELMYEYFRLLTDYNLKEIKKLHPLKAKLTLAQSIVENYYSKNIATKERKEFEKVFSQRQLPEDIPVFSAGEEIDIVDILYKTSLISSKNEGRRLLSQGGINIVEGSLKETRPLKDQRIKVPRRGLILKIGKRKFLKLLP